MPIKKILSRIAIIGLLQAGIVAAVIFAAPGTQTSAQEASSILLADPPPVEIAPQTPAPEVVPGSLLGLEGTPAGTRTGDFFSVGPFAITGNASIITDDFGQSVLWLSEDFRASRGQRIVVTLQTDNGTSIELGELQGSGAQSFDVPFINLDVFDEVVLIDEPFDTVFGIAELLPA